MSLKKAHIENIFRQKFSLLDYKCLIEYFKNDQLSDEAKQVMLEQWDQFEANSVDQEELSPIFYKLYYSISQNDQGYKNRKPNFWLTRIAAVFIVGLLIATGIYIGRSGLANRYQTVEFISQTGFRNQFKLPDGTTGWLGHGSDLKFHMNKAHERIVDLDGLAYFEVAHNKRQPFIVNTPAQLDIRVLGTKFNVSSYSSEHSCEVVLQQGSVNLSLNGKTIDHMKPDERVEYHSNNHAYHKSKVNVADYLAWKDGRLVLNDVSLAEACIKLSHFYNVDFELRTEGLNGQKIRLILENESLEDAINLLDMIAPVRCQVEEPKIENNNRVTKKKIIVLNK